MSAVKVSWYAIEETQRGISAAPPTQTISAEGIRATDMSTPSASRASPLATNSKLAEAHCVTPS